MAATGRAGVEHQASSGAERPVIFPVRCLIPPCFRLVITGICLLAMLAEAGAQARKGKPRVPPGRDPGGVAVAVTGGGVNYLRPEIARRLARDGEGEPIAFDLEDMDNRPLELIGRAPAAATRPDTRGVASALAGLLLAEAGAARLVVTRDPPGDGPSAARGIAFVALTPARIVLVLSQPADWEPFLQAVARFKELLVIVPATRATEGLAQRLAGAAVAERANLLIVAASPNESATATDWPGRLVDVEAPAVPLEAERKPEERPALLLDGSVAAARVAALAARLVAAEPQLEGASLKARILDFARRPADIGNARSNAGAIAEPHRVFRSE
jgi:hypothetical protein